MIDPKDNLQAVSEELISAAHARSLDLRSIAGDYTFSVDDRWIFFWRKDEFAYSGSVADPVGTLHYSLQGSIGQLPSEFKASFSAFRGTWSEAGTVESIDQAIGLLQAWLLNRCEVDELPTRRVRRRGI